METQYARTTANQYTDNLSANTLANPSAVSWGAIFAGAAAAAALSLILLILGTGLGFASVSPWSGEGISGTTFSVSTIVWITLTSLLASAVGGYIAGRLRSRWLATHTDEVYFRDTAHGFLAWAVSTLATATLLTSVIASIVGTGAQIGAKITGGTLAATSAAATTAAVVSDKAGDTGGANDDGTVLPYFTDMLFRKSAAPAVTDPAAANAPAANAPASNGPTIPPSVEPKPGTDASKAEVARIFVNAMAVGSLSAEDSQYAAQVISQSTGISQADAEKRVADTFKSMQAKLHAAETTAREAADKARKATAYGSLWLFVSLLIGAFVASFAATYGGRQRDL